MTSLMETLGNDAVLFAFFSSVLFMAGYSFLAKWWRTEIGRARISLDLGIALALSPAFLHMAFGIEVDNSTAFGWYTICAIVFVGLVSLWNLAIVARVQTKRQRKHDDGKAADRNPGPPG